MFPERFIRRVVLFLTVTFFLITLSTWASVSKADIGGLAADALFASNKVIAAENHAFPGGVEQLLQFFLLLLLFAMALGLVLCWRRKSNFYRREIARAERKAQEVLELYTLRQTEFDTVLDMVSDLVMFLTPDLKIIWVNKRAESTLGMECSTIIGRSCHEIWHTMIGDGFLCPGRTCLISGVPERSIGWTREKMQFDIRAVPVRDSCGEIVRIVEIGSDITSARHLEQQLRHLQKMESIGWLTTGIIHDFNNILTGIIGFGFLLQKKFNGDEQAGSYLSHIIFAAERAEILTRTFLAFTRKQSVSIMPDDLNDIIRGVEDLLVRVLGEDVDFRKSLPDSKIPVLADSLLLGQVLLNIAVHCRNTMFTGGDFHLKTSISILPSGNCDGKSAESEYYACLQIEIPAGMVTWQCWEVLHEGSPSAASFGKGVDLGLAVVRGIVEQHGGTITFSTGIDTGAVFTILLPLYRQADFVSRKENRSVALFGRNENILVVEDDMWARSCIREICEKFGYGIIEAGDAMEAVEKFREHGSSVSLVLCDMVLPKMNGRELCRELARTCPDLKVLFMSGYPGDVIRARGIATEGITVLSKPFKPEDLLHAVRSALTVAG